MIKAFLISVFAFASTNIDDLFILMVLFGSKRYNKIQIVTGQLLGILTLIAISLAGTLAGKIMDSRYIGLLGLFPVYLAIKEIYQYYFSKDNDEEESIEVTGGKGVVLSLAFITIANGGDNIGIYIPLLTTFASHEKFVFVLISLIMVFIWCYIAMIIVRHALVASALKRYSHVLLPLALLILGITILYESNALSLFLPLE